MTGATSGGADGGAGGEALGAWTLRHRVVGPMRTNAYLLRHGSGARVLVDPGEDAAALLALLDEDGDRALDLVVVTHRHPDHVGALAAVVAATGAPVAAGADDAAAITDATGVPVTHRLSDGDRLPFAAADAAARADAPGVVALRGHTPGSVALVVGTAATGTHLLTGDSLFPGGVGNTGGDATRFASLLADVRARLFDRFDDATTVRPGHGDPTTLGAERPHLEEWAARGW